MDINRFHDKDKAFEMSMYYRATFDSLQGREVLKDILTLLYYFQDDIPGTAQELIGKQNAGREIAKMCGGWTNPDAYADATVHGILNVPLIKPEDLEEESNE